MKFAPVFMISHLLLAPFAFAEKEQGVVSFQASPECGPVETRAEAVPENDDPSQGIIGEACRANFSDFNATVSAGSSMQKSCHLEALIKVPPGKQFRATAASVEGIYRTSPDTWGSVNLSYSLDATGGFASQGQGISGATQGDFNIYAQIDRQEFTNCSDQVQYVRLSSDISLNLRDYGNGAESMIDVDAAGRSQELSWNWQWKGCSISKYNRTLISYYKAYNQRNYRAVINLNGSSGTYVSDAGFTGYFYDVRYSEGGTVAEGRWNASGKEGWFRFKMYDTSYGEFRGEWGDDTGAQGQWWGSF